MADNSSAIETAGQQPKSATVDGNSVTAHSIPDQIAADQYGKVVDAMDKPHKGLRFSKLKPSGSS